MAIVTYPLNDVDYTAEDAELFHCTRTSGIHAGSDFSCSVTGADNYVTINPGIAWIHNSTFAGKVAAMKSAARLDLGVPNSTYDRIDAIVLQFDASANETKLIVKTGTASISGTSNPDLSRTAQLYELHLYHVYRKAGATAITPADITDLRMNSTYCGLMADSVTEVDMSSVNKKVDALLDRLEEEANTRLDALDKMINNGTGLPALSASNAGWFIRANDAGTGYELVDLINLYVWKKFSAKPGLVETEESGVDNTCITRDGSTVKYADAINIEDDVISLVNPITATDLTESGLKVILGKYIYAGYSNSYYYIPSDANIGKRTPTYGSSYIYATPRVKLTISGAKLGLVTSTERDTYPTSGEHTDGYWYEYSKQMGD